MVAHSYSCRRAWHLLSLLLFVLLFSSCFAATGPPVDLWKYRNEGRWIVDGRWWYFELNHTRHLWADHYTIFAYGFNAYFSLGQTEFSWLRSPVWPSKEELATLPEGAPIATKWDNRPNAALQSLAKSTDPSVLKVKDEALLFDRSNVGLVYRRYYNDWIAASESKVVRIPGENGTSIASANFSQVAQWLNGIDKIAGVSTPWVFCKGGDPRLLALDDGRTILVTNHHNPAIDRVETTYAELVVNLTSPGTPLVSCKNGVVVLSARDEKNWTPFAWRGGVFFLASIWPFHVINITVADPSKHPHVALVAPDESVGIINTVSLMHLDHASCSMKFPWSSHHLALRGGTQAVDIGNNTYFGIFHAQNNCSADDYGTLKTYTMGAFTFVGTDNHTMQNNNPSFRITAVSSAPIVKESWYTGPWLYHPNAFGKIDYVVFPMSVIVEGDDLAIVYGRQDASTWVTRLSLREVLSSLVPVSPDGVCGERKRKEGRGRRERRSDEKSALLFMT